MKKILIPLTALILLTCTPMHVAASGPQYGMMLSSLDAAALNDLSVHQQTWVRYGVGEQSVLNESLSHGTVLVWNEAGLSALDAQLQAVHGAHLKAMLLVGAPVTFTKSLSSADYLSVVTQYYTHLSQHLSAVVDGWEMWNEGNLGDFRQRGAPIGAWSSGAPMPTLSAPYIAELTAAFAAARSAIRSASSAPISSSVASQYASYDGAVQAGFVSYLDAVASNFDAVNLHMYDAMEASTVSQSLAQLNAIKARYGKPVYVTEYGWYGGVPGEASFSDAEQARIVPQQERALSQVASVLIQFQYNDARTSPTYLGLLRADGSQKPAYRAYYEAQGAWPLSVPVPRSSVQEQSTGTEPPAKPPARSSQATTNAAPTVAPAPPTRNGAAGQSTPAAMPGKR